MKQKSIIAFLILVIAVLFSACDNKQTQVNFGFTLAEDEPLSFELDEQTTFENTNSQPIKIGDKDFLLGFDGNQGHLNFYDIERQEFSHKQVFDKGQGINGILYPMSIDYIKPDSIFIYGYSQGAVLLNKSSEVSQSYNVGYLSDDAENPGEALILGSSRIQYLNDRLYFSTYPRNQKGETFFEYDLSTGNTTHYVPYPSDYTDLLVNYYNVWSSLNKTHKQAVTSFTLDDSLRVLDLETKAIKKIYAGSQYFKKPPRKHVRNTLTMSSSKKVVKKATVRFHKNAQYGPVLFDEQREVYYRLCYLPLIKDDINEGSYFRDFSVITIAPDGTILAEDIIENEDGRFGVMFPEAMWFTHGGSLYLQRLNTENEDELVYSKFTLTKRS